jgi:hypothetical protein
LSADRSPRGENRKFDSSHDNQCLNGFLIHGRERRRRAVAATNVLTINPSVPARNLGDLIALIKSNPGKYNYASGGVGTQAHLLGEMLRLSLALDIVHVPFNGGGPEIASIVAGHTPIGWSAPEQMLQSEAGYIDARPKSRQIDETSCDARPSNTKTSTRRILSVPRFAESCCATGIVRRSPFDARLNYCRSASVFRITSAIARNRSRMA